MELAIPRDMSNSNMKSTVVAGYITRLIERPTHILCVDGEFYPESWVGVGGRAAKVYKTERGAVRHNAYRGVTASAVNEYGIEISWLNQKYGVKE
jgi:hypothetical protein